MKINSYCQKTKEKAQVYVGLKIHTFGSNFRKNLVWSLATMLDSRSTILALNLEKDLFSTSCNYVGFKKHNSRSSFRTKLIFDLMREVQTNFISNFRKKNLIFDLMEEIQTYRDELIKPT